MDSHACSSADQVEELVKSFLTRLLIVPELQSAKIIFCAERNMAHEAGFIAKFVKREFPRSYAIAQKPDNDYGWYTTHDQKIQYAMALVACMSNEALVFSKQMRCATPTFLGTSVPEERLATIKQKLFEQMGRYRMVQSQSHNALFIPRSTVSGKVDKEGRVSGAFNDDLIFSLSMCIWLTRELLLNRIPHMPSDFIHKG